MLEKLKNEHVELGKLADMLAEYIAHDELADPEGLGRCRWRFIRLMTAHLALEDAHVYGPLASDPRREAGEMSRWFQRELGKLRGDFIVHAARWTADAVNADWQGYRRALRAMLETHTARTKLEEERLYPLLESAPAVRRAA